MVAETIGHIQATGNGAAGENGLCLHALQGAAPAAKICINSYQCRQCAYDQWIEVMEYTHHNGERAVPHKEEG